MSGRGTVGGLWLTVTLMLAISPLSSGQGNALTAIIDIAGWYLIIYSQNSVVASYFSLPLQLKFQ